MILDNENNNPKVYEWICENTNKGKMDIVTGYFTIGALAYLSNNINEYIDNYRLILGNIVSKESKEENPLDLLNENLSIEACFELHKLAKEAVSFLAQKKVIIKTLEPNFCHAKAYIHQRAGKKIRDSYYITGSSNLTEAGIGKRSNNNIELNLAGSGDAPQYSELVEWFNNLWENPKAHLKKTIIKENGEKKQIDFKEYLIEEIQKIFKKYTPKKIYYKILYELFGNDLLIEKSNPEFNRQIGRLENSIVYNTLYEFQKKGVLSLIKMLQKYNGAILADAVGLGKTWSALAVMKFFQIEGFDIILMCPKKLRNNWERYLKNRFSKFEEDKFDYTIRYHTDLFEDRMNKDGITLTDYFQSDRPKLLVIDESHNLRNNKSSRYEFLVNNILKKNSLIKVLMLSATPINNSLLDIRNQFKLMVKDNNTGFYETIGIKNIDSTFRTAQKKFNEWRERPNPVIADFIRALPPNFFKLTDALIVARTRKMIEGMQDGLVFPKKEKPENLFVTPKSIGNFENFEELFDHFPPKLSGYQPAFYADEGIAKNVLEDEKKRDEFLVKMMYILMVKRLESSWFSFNQTINRIRDHHENALNKINNYLKTKEDFQAENPEDTIFDDEEMANVFEELTLGKKRKIKLSDIDKNNMIDTFKKDIKKDLESLDNLKSNLDRFSKEIKKEIKIKNNQKSKDSKIEILIEKINKKRVSGYNNRNKKVIIFTVYKDTATYLYEQLKNRGFDKLAMVSGDESRTWDSNEATTKFEVILERFAPFTKLFKEKEWKTFESKEENILLQFEDWKKWVVTKDKDTEDKISNPIDILVATDVLSEGQNLQDCDLVINYDIHWNPVRVIQRMGRIDRLGSPNEKIFGINFWPTENINAYLNLQDRIEQRMATMQLAGAEVDTGFSDSFEQMAKDEHFENKQKARMLEQMQTSWDEIEVSEQGLGFNDLSLEIFRQDLLDELRNKEKLYKAMPNGVYSGFMKNKDFSNNTDLIVLLGSPAKKNGTNKDFKYKTHELIYINSKGEDILLNQKEILDFLSANKDKDRYVDKKIDMADEATLKNLIQSLKRWIKNQAVEIEVQDNGTTKEKMGKSTLDILNKLKVGDKDAVDRVKQNKTEEDIFNPDNFDLITWIVVS